MSRRARQPLFRLATANFRAHCWINIKLCAVFVCMSILICLFAAFNMSVESRRQEIFAYSASSNYMYGASDRSQLLEEYGLTDYQYYTLGRYNLSEIMKENINADIPTVTTNFISLAVEGIDGGKPRAFLSDKTPEMLWLYKGDPFQNDIDKREMRDRFGSDELYIGSFPKDGSREILISEKLLEGYGLEPEQVIGRQLQIWLGEHAEQIWTNLTVTGVIVKEYYQLSGHLEGNWQIAPSVVAAENNGIYAINVKVDTLHVYVFDEWSTLSVDDLNDISTEGELSYCGIASYRQREFLNNIREVVVNVFYVVGSILAAGLLLTVMLMIDKFVAVFCRTGGILLSCGLDNGNLIRLLFVQILLLFLASLPLALVGSLVGYAVVVQLVAAGTGISMTVSSLTVAKLVALSATAVFASAVAFFGCAALQLRKKTVKQLLTTEIS